MESLITIGAENLTSVTSPELSITMFANVLTTTSGPHAMRQMNFNNQTVVDKVPPEMLHLIDPHWLFFTFSYSCTICFCKDRERKKDSSKYLNYYTGTNFHH